MLIVGNGSENGCCALDNCLSINNKWAFCANTNNPFDRIGTSFKNMIYFNDKWYTNNFYVSVDLKTKTVSNPCTFDSQPIEYELTWENFVVGTNFIANDIKESNETLYMVGGTSSSTTSSTTTSPSIYKLSDNKWESLSIDLNKNTSIESICFSPFST